MSGRNLTDADVVALVDEFERRGLVVGSGPPSPSEPELVNATQLSRRLGSGAPSADYFRKHFSEYGGQRLGNGPRPRILFDLDTVREALRRQRGETPTLAPRRRRARREGGLLPVIGGNGR